ncbi:MAG: phenylpyruvate tautomerase MIF-related protein [Ruminococcus sp.]|nr:phenylpyruvate tautomerase MIF-related protein [Ruminococcus sp.]
MPFINVKTNVKLDDNKKAELNKRLTNAVTVIPGKSVGYIMSAVEDDISMMFGGKNDSPIAFVNVSVLHSASRSSYEKLTAEIQNILKDVAGINDNCYVAYFETENWGMNGFMF